MTEKKSIPYQAAFVACDGGCHVSKEGTGCTQGCQACGDCIEVCSSQAISINADGVAEVDEAKCTACGNCVDVCRQHLIRLHDGANRIVVKCSNHSKGAQAKTECAVSCIGCGICEKTCTACAVKVIDFCAVIDEKYCLSCGMCAVKCPRHAIHDLRGIY